jgi:excisionase family DNA binding protein
MEQIGNDILTTGEAATLCGVSRSTLRRAVAQGQLTAWHVVGRAHGAREPERETATQRV